MSLGPDIAYRQNEVLCDLALDAKVVLRCVLSAKVRLKLAEKQNRPEGRPIHRSSRRWSKNSVEGVGGNREIAGAAALAHEGSHKKAFRNERAATEWRLALELFQHELLDRVIENPEAAANRGLPVLLGIPGEAYSRRKGLVVARSQSLGNTLVSGDH